MGEGSGEEGRLMGWGTPLLICIRLDSIKRTAPDRLTRFGHIRSFAQAFLPRFGRQLHSRQRTFAPERCGPGASVNGPSSTLKIMLRQSQRLYDIP